MSMVRTALVSICRRSAWCSVPCSFRPVLPRRCPSPRSFATTQRYRLDDDDGYLFLPSGWKHLRNQLPDGLPDESHPLEVRDELDGCDGRHWLVAMAHPDGNPTRDEIIDSYIKTLSAVVGSEEDARKRIYSVSTRHYYAFGCILYGRALYELTSVPRVRFVIPDCYLDAKKKDYGGEPFIDGKAVPYDPKYHRRWARNNARYMRQEKYVGSES